MDLSINLSIDPNNSVQYIYKDYYILQNVSEKKALSILKDNDDGSWIFRFDYITQKYYLTIKNNDEFINHHVLYYCKRTDEVIIQLSDKTSEVYPSLNDYLVDMTQIYSINLSKQIIV